MSRQDRLREKRMFEQKTAKKREMGALYDKVGALFLPAARASRDKTAVGYERSEDFRARMAAQGATWWNIEPSREHPDVTADIHGTVVYTDRRLNLYWLPEDLALFMLTLVWEPRAPLSPLEQLAREA